MAIWQVARGRRITLERNSCIMGIVNITPDSFSDGNKNLHMHDALNSIQTLSREGADIIDIGGESTRPNATALSPHEEQQRILPVLDTLKKQDKIIVSVDTYHSETALAALERGAHIINDVFGLQYDPVIAEITASYGAGIVIMHTNRNRTPLADPIDDKKAFFTTSLKLAQKAGIKEANIVLDPGFGFGKDAALNIKLFQRIGELKALGFPLLAGTSRKRFLGHLSQYSTPTELDIATAASSALLRQQGFAIFRVHNVAMNREALNLADALLAKGHLDA